MQLQELINTKNSQILEHKLFLERTDYKVIRTAENYEVDDETLSQRENARIEIRALEADIEQLELEMRELDQEQTIQSDDYQ